MKPTGDPLTAPSYLGIRACLAGHGVAFATAIEWIARLADVQRAGRLEDELKRLGRFPSLIVDEIGCIPLEPEAANLMFTLVSRRYGLGCAPQPARSRGPKPARRVVFERRSWVHFQPDLTPEAPRRPARRAKMHGRLLRPLAHSA